MPLSANHIRIALLIPIGAALLILPCLAGEPDSGELSPPPEVLSWRHQILSRSEYFDLADQWEAYVHQHPNEPRAWVEWGDALRYAGEGADGGEKYARAFEIDSTDAAAISAHVSFNLCHQMDEREQWNRAHQRLLRAVQVDPDYPEIYYTLWLTAMILGDQSRADDCLRRMVALDDIPRPLLEHAYNMLIGVPPGAIIFTNGDNDTYPPLAMQVLAGERTDVSIVNLSLLNTRWYIRYLRDHGVPIGLDDAAIDALTHEQGSLIADKIQRHIFDKLAREGWPRPLFYSLTVAEARKTLPCKRVLEGVHWRIVPAWGEEIGLEEHNIARSRELLDTLYRLDGMTDPLIDWERDAAVSRLGLNYAAVLGRIGLALIDLEGPGSGRPYLFRALKVLAFHGAIEMAEKLLQAWSHEDPDETVRQRARALLEEL